MLKKIGDKKPLAQFVADEIIRLIEEGKLKPGDKLPSESELMESLSVGRGSIREAIKILVSRNIVTIRRGVGTYVSEKKGISDDPLGFSFIEDKQQLVHDSMAVRALLEPSIAKWATIHASDEEISEIERMCDVIEEKIRAGEDYGDADVEFHTQIAKSTKNLVVSNLIPILNMNIRMLIDVTQASLKEETIITHRDIVEALKKRDAGAVFLAMNAHMSINQERINRLSKK